MFGWFKSTLASLVHLLALYHHYSVIVELVLELYCETAKRILCYFTAAESRFLYENSLALIRTYAERQVGRRTVDKEAEEEQYRDLLLLMELLTNLLSKVSHFKFSGFPITTQRFNNPLWGEDDFVATFELNNTPICMS